MKRPIILFSAATLLFITLSASFSPQTKYIASGKIDFSSDAPLELIEASSDQLEGVLDTRNKEFLFRVKMTSFQGFNSALQREHFNDNYVESDKYPQASFKGKIIEDINFSQPGKYTIRAKGNFSLHGVEQNRIIKCNLEVKNGIISVKSKFSVFLEEHNIRIPKIVNQKIAEEINVTVSATLKQKK